MAIDLLIKGGQVLDPGQGLDGSMDIARENGVPFMAHVGNRFADQSRGELIAPDWGPHPWGWLPEPA